MGEKVSSSTAMQVDVVVVGAGPVGLLLAAELALGRASVLLIERANAAAATVKAGSINIASAEMLARRGLQVQARAAHQHAVHKVAEMMASQGMDPEHAHAAVRRRTRRAGHFAAIMLDSEKLDVSNPDIVAHDEMSDATLIAQREIELLLAWNSERHGIVVRRDVEVTGVRQSPADVIVETSAGPVRARYVVGCDGGRSTVRKSAGFDFPGSEPEITGRQALVDLDDPSRLTFGWNWSERGVYRYGPTPGLLLTVEFEGAPDDRTSAVTADEMTRSLRLVSGLDVNVERVHGQSWRWTDNARQAATYRDRRILLAGDAAHVHSPFSGQGLNLGLGDAMNLGWKLAATVRGWAPDRLLDTYDAERHPVGAWVLDWTRAQVALMRPDPKIAQLRAVFAELMGTPDGMTLIVNKISGVAWRVDLPGTHPLIGRIVPDMALADGRSIRDLFTSGRFVLLDRTSDGVFAAAAIGWRDRLAIEHDASVAPRPVPAAMLVRPDGVVVWATASAEPTDTDDLVQGLRAWAGASLPSGVARRSHASACRFDTAVLHGADDQRSQPKVEVGVGLELADYGPGARQCRR